MAKLKHSLAHIDDLITDEDALDFLETLGWKSEAVEVAEHITKGHGPSDQKKHAGKGRGRSQGKTEYESAMAKLPAAQQKAIKAFMKKQGITHEEAVQRTLDAYDSASSQNMKEYNGIDATAAEYGTNWYAKERTRMNKVAAEIGVDDETFAAMTAAVSPNSAWQRENGSMPNLSHSARIATALKNDVEVDITPEVIAHWKGRKPASEIDLTAHAGKRKLSELPSDVAARIMNDTVASGDGSTTGWPNVDKAIRIYRGEKVDVVMNPVTSPKTSAFNQGFQTRGRSTRPVIDRHMVRIASGKVVNTKYYQDLVDGPNRPRGKGWKAKAGYDFFSDIVADAAARRGVRVSDMQAVAWNSYLAAGNLLSREDFESEEHITPNHGPSDQKKHAGGRGRSGGGDIYEKLRTGEVKNIYFLGGGISETYVGEIDGVGKVVIRPHYPGGGRASNNMRDLNAEVAAHEVDKALGKAIGQDTLHGSPEVVIRDLTVDGSASISSVQRMLPGRTPKSLLYDAAGSEYNKVQRLTNDGYREFNAFDYATGNGDRHPGNMIYHDGKMYPIDHSLAFTGSGYPTKPSLVNKRVRDSFEALTQNNSLMDDLELDLGKILNDDSEAEATIVRIMQVPALGLQSEHITPNHGPSDQKKHAGGRGGGGGGNVYDKLAKGELKNVRPLNAGISETYVGKIDGVGNVLIRPHYPNGVMGPGNAKRDLDAEIAAHAVDRALGQAIGKDTYLGSPEVVMRTEKFQDEDAVLTVQRIIPGKTPKAMGDAFDGPLTTRGRKEFQNFDYVVQNGDRHRANMIYHEDKLYPIDHSLAFDRYSPQARHSLADGRVFNALVSNQSLLDGLRNDLASMLGDDVADGAITRLRNVAAFTP